MPNEALRIHNMEFAVTSQIERAPHWTMIRELTMNAVEAASRAAGDKIVHWTSENYNGVRKAVLYNTGPGMSDAELKAATDLACEVRKTLGLDENFGVGAKVSSLANNKLGMRFRSCKAGRASEVILGYDPEVEQYVRFDRDIGGKHDTVIDVTAVVQREGRAINYDWTEVMLLGNSEEQDTAARPFAIELTDKNYIATSLYRRFYRLPKGVKLRLDANYHRLDGTRTLIPIGQRYEKFAHTESVAVPELNLSIHYLHDPWVGDKSGNRVSSSAALGSTTTTCALVHKDEMYSVMTGPEWSAAAPRFGIPFGSKELCIHIELAESEARPTQYRERLISKQSGSDVLPTDYAFAVQERMPDWVKDVIRSASPRRSEDFNDIRRELQELLKKYLVRVTGRKFDEQLGRPSIEKKGQEFGFGGRGGSASGHSVGSRRRFHEVPEGAVTTSLYEIFERAPKITMLETIEDVLDKGLRGRAAEFILETGDLFVNGLYEAVDRTVKDLEPEFVASGDAELVRRLVTNGARRSLALRVGRATVFALAKRANEDWSDDAMRAALSKESLSIAADNYEESLSSVRRHVRGGLKFEKVAA